MYSAYCVNAPDGTVRLAVFFDGFEDQESAQFFLQMLMSPFEQPHYIELSETIH